MHKDEQRAETETAVPTTHPACRSMANSEGFRSIHSLKKTSIVPLSDAFRLLRKGESKFAMVVHLAIVFVLLLAMTLSENK